MEDLTHDDELGKELRYFLEIKGIYFLPPRRVVERLKRKGLQEVHYDEANQIVKFSFPFETPYFSTRVYCEISFFYENCDVAYKRKLASYERNELLKYMKSLFEKF